MRRIGVEETEALLQAIQQASGIDKKGFNRARRGHEKRLKNAKARKQKAKVRAKQDNKSDEVPLGWTLDMHLHNRCFKSSKKKRIVINDAFYEYQSKHGYWRVLDDRDVLKEIALASNSAFVWAGSKNAKYPKYCGSQAGAKSGLQYSRMILTLTDSTKPENKHLRAFSNCTVDMRTGEPTQHRSDHYLTSAISAEYHPGAECPEIFHRFIHTSYGKDMELIIRAAISMILDPTAPWGKFIHIIGPSGSGKGVLLRLLQEIFGKENTKGGSAFSDFSDPERRHQNLQGCALYVIGDIAGYQRGLESFYDLVDNAPMTGRALFSSTAYTEKWNVRFAIASVEYLQLENSSGGWDRRVLPILSQRRDGSDDIEGLETKLADAKAGIISWALAMSKDERNAVLKKPWDYSDRVAVAMHESSVHGDSVKSFVDSCLQPVEYGSTLVESTMHPGEIHDLYLAYCLSHKLLAKGQPKFISHLKTVIPKHFVPRRRMSADETNERDKSGKPPRAPSKWVWLKPIQMAFTTSFDDNGISRIVCNKHSCKTGQLDLFDEWQPIIPEKSVQGVQGCPETEKTLEPNKINGVPSVQGVQGNSGPNQENKKNASNLERF